MKKITFAILTAGVTALSGAQAQQSGQTGASMLPKGCQAALQASGQAQMLEGMKGKMDQAMQMPNMDQMNETQKGLHQAMMKMHPPMMQGMVAKDADVAWICSMIPHHQGAIDMARAGLKQADNAESKQLAEETIKSNEKEMAKLIAWVEKNAERENRNETTGATPRR
jgi:uncharacterized protein (DUF305 family)